SSTGWTPRCRCSARCWKSPTSDRATTRSTGWKSGWRRPTADALAVRFRPCRRQISSKKFAKILPRILVVTPMLDPDLLLQAYAMGIFPMAQGRDDRHVHWIDPRRRGIFPLDGFHISRSLARLIRRWDCSIRTDTAFAAVVDA